MKRLVLVLALLAAALTVSVLAAPGIGKADGDDDDSYAIGLWGDVPYSTTQADRRRAEPDRRHEQAATSNSPSTTATSRQGSGSPCDNALYTRWRSATSTRCAPARVHAGRQRLDGLRPARQRRLHSLERLDHIRSTMFDSAVLVRRSERMRQTRAGSAPYVENRRWRVGGVTYATLNITGLVQQPLRHRRRTQPSSLRATQAIIAWMHETFASRGVAPLAA